MRHGSFTSIVSVWLVAIWLAVLLGGCLSGDRINTDDPTLRYHHDAIHGVGCWTLYADAIHCIPDQDYVWRAE